MKDIYITKSVSISALAAILALQSCGDHPNNPYPNEKSNTNAIYSVFTERPKHLDPAMGFNENEALITCQVYEPPLQYAYLTRPFTLIPLTTTEMPSVRYETVGGKEYSIYTITIKPGIYYQPHPAFAKDATTGEFLYHTLPANAPYRTIGDFADTGTRELVADDYVFEIKRLADPKISSPIYGLMADYIVGLRELSQQLRQIATQQDGSQQNNAQVMSAQTDLTLLPLSGVKAIDTYRYEITIYGRYPQFLYWLSMPFFSPMPWEAIAFYNQPILQANNVTLDWFPVGTGPFMMQENNPNLRMLLTKNPNYHGETYPDNGDSADTAAGLQINAGKPLPLLDSVIFTREKETIPYWAKFLQGYYDQAAVNSDNFDQAVKIVGAGDIEVSEEVKAKKIRLSQSVTPSMFYLGFNMLDDTVGGLTDKKRKLRQAINIAMNIEQYVNIFMNGGGVALPGPIPPGIFGHVNDKDHFNDIVFTLNEHQHIVRRPISDAQKLLKEAGYPNGINPKTKKPLILYLDLMASSNPDAQAQVTWYRAQLKRIGIDLVIRATQYNRFQDKMSNGDFQIYFWGWNADYPDPENFLFLLITKNSRVKTAGENASNYSNPEFDALFDQMKMMPNSPERAAVIQQMVNIVQKDSPWVWGFTPTNYVLRQQWVGPFKPNAMARNLYKYMSVNPELRDKYQLEWNHPVRWPILLGLLLLIVLCIPAGILYWQKMHRPLRLSSDLRKKRDDK